MKAIEYSGKRYEASVPDTLDLAERARLAINGLGGIIDPDISHTSFFTVSYKQNVPTLEHTGADILCDPKIMESLMLMRIISGSSQYREIEDTQRGELIGRIKDGLYWNFADEARPWRASYSAMYDHRNPGGTSEDLCPVYGAGRMLRALVNICGLKSDPFVEMKIRELTGGLQRIVVTKDDYCYFPDGGYGEPFNYPASGWISTDEAMSEVEGGEGAVTAFQAGSIYALTKWYNLSGDTAALQLAGRLARYCMLPKFWGGMVGTDRVEKGDRPKPLPDPCGIAGFELGHWFSHFHTRAITLRAILEYGMATHDWRMKEFVRRAYEFTLTNGIARIGWISSGPNPFGSNIMEGCNLGDLAALGIRLSDAGMGDYWDDVDALARNQMVEGQLIDAGMLRGVSESYSAKDSEEKMKGILGDVPTKVVTRNVIERTLGVFAAWIKPASVPDPWSAGCCNGNATQGLYYVWEGILREHGDHAQINLLLNRASKSLDVDSYLPYEGKVIIHNKAVRRLSVRIPSWVERKSISIRAQGRPLSWDWAGNYVLLPGLKPNEDIVVEFPVPQSTARYTAAYRTPDELTYTCTFRGSTLVNISPCDERPTSYKLYQRDHMRRDTSPIKKIERFVPNRIIMGW